MTEAASFWTDFNEQQYGELLLVAVVAAGVYSLLLVVPAFTGSFGSHALRPLLWSAAALQLFVVALTFYEAAAHYYRRVPAGSDAERQGQAFEDWQFRARVGFVVLYVGAVGLAAMVGYLFDRRRGALVAAGSVVGFMLLTSWFVEYTNVCEIGYGWANFECD